jgi:multidrug transporter EmrE-like cation transporter
MVTAWGAVAILLFSGLFQAGGEYVSKLWGFHQSWQTGLLAVALYAVSSAIWLPALLYKNQLSTIGVAWDLVAISATLLLGIFVFHEVLHARQWLGLILAAVALWLLVW